MTVEQALTELIKNGFEIEQFETDKFIVIDNGKFGFCNDEDPFIVDGDEILEIYEMYLED
jgi:hypothetical protein